jgi:phage-related minor tail protein
MEYAPGLFAPGPFANGGIVTSPVLGLVGEAGPEAIIPLDRAGALGGDTYVINVSGAIDPEGTARTILRVLNDAQRRTGRQVTTFAPGAGQLL